MRLRRTRLVVAEQGLFVEQQMGGARVLGHQQRAGRAQVGGGAVEHGQDFAARRLGDANRLLEVSGDLRQKCPAKHLARLLHLRDEGQDGFNTRLVGSAAVLVVQRGEPGADRAREPFHRRAAPPRVRRQAPVAVAHARLAGVDQVRHQIGEA